ncbi:PQQ-like beta-propeller repeat protein [Streptomyces sp. NBC_01387]|uniref:outer membrane protein assembly factor BamB family protein n=1 Tax=Streptomyces sp. NBC_01387 TaxID=2903849 RepID=UPI0032465D7B
MKDDLDGWTWNSSGTESEDPPVVGPDGRVPRIRRSPAESARATAAWVRVRAVKLVTVAVVLALAIGGWQTYKYLTRYHEQMSGPHGDFPAALGSSAPVKPSRVVATFEGSMSGIAGGLYLHEEPRGVTAFSLRTGKSYWHYGREKTGLVDVTNSRDTVVLSFDDQLVVGIDAHSGKPRWHVKVPGDAKSGQSRLWLDKDTVILSQPASVTALAVHDGKRLWTAPPPKGCRKWAVRAPVALKDVVAYRATDCEGSSDEYVLSGMDRSTGHPRWQLKDEITGYWRLDDHTMATASVRDALVVTDVSGSRPRTRSTALSNDLSLGYADDNIMVFDSSNSRTLTAIRVTADRNRTAWTHPAAKGLEFGRPWIADGRVYVTQGVPPLDARRDKVPASARLLVLDARTGHELSRADLPKSLFQGENEDQRSLPAIRGAGSGVVLIGWADFAFSSVDLALAE